MRLHHHHTHCDCHAPSRRAFLARAGAAPLLLTPIAALLAACGRGEGWPQGMAAIHWDRDVCTGCGMVISDRRFAVEVRGGPRDAVFKFDDIGCFLAWRAAVESENPWLATPGGARLWVADSSSDKSAVRWLDPRTARYVPQQSPMGYGFAALPPGGEGIDFEEMSRKALAQGMPGMHGMPAMQDMNGGHGMSGAHPAHDAAKETQ